MKSLNSLFLILTLCFSSVIFIHCRSTESKVSGFSGDAKALALAEKMFAAIGGKKGWCDLKSLYVKAEHTEPQMSIPYQSEIWRATDTFEVIIEQQNDSFHVKAVITELGGTIQYLDQRDTFRTLSTEQLEGWKFDHEHNIYVLLHQLACHPETYQVTVDSLQNLTFHRGTTFVTRLGLDEQFRPVYFYRPNQDGTVSGSFFSRLGTDGGLVHSAGGHPLDSNFMYQTEIWQPSQTSLIETFGKQIFEVK